MWVDAEDDGEVSGDHLGLGTARRSLSARSFASTTSGSSFSKMPANCLTCVAKAP